MTDTVRIIRLYGMLGARFGRVHKLAVNSAAEAIRALCVLIPGFEAYLTNSKDRNEGYAVFYGKKNLSENELHNPCSRDEIRIAPMLMGAKKNGIGAIIAGIVLIVIGIIGNIYGGWGTPFIQAGIGMIAGGIVQLLTPMPKGNAGRDRADQTASYAFNGPINTQAQGNPVPLLYGECIVGSAVISAGISVADQAIIPRPGAGGGYGGGSTRHNSDYYNTQLQ